ncbi:MAG: hypothetical protein IJP77_10615 [Bacteroidales bacterium]|nr:hypothetical protein [Bacteroidales bacterium]
MMRHRHIVLLLLLVVLACACDRQDRLDRSSRTLLEELDRYVSVRELYVARKLQQTDALRHLAQSVRDPRIQYETELDLASEFFSFSFDSTQACLQHCQSLALHPLHDQDCYDLATIRLGHLYTKSGNYMEAYNILCQQLDTASLSESLQIEYLTALYDFGVDMTGNSGMVEQLDIPDLDTLRTRLMALLPKDSPQWQTLQRDAFLAQRRLASADSISRILMAGIKPEERAYAIEAFYQSIIAEQMGNPTERLAWLVRSAESDIVNAVKDYASLTMVAELILRADVDRSFHYLRIAQEDALFYNARLRPWQISRSMMQVQDAYSARQDLSRKAVNVATILLALLALLLSLLAWFLIVRSRNLSRLQRRLEESNDQLAAANAQLGQLNQEISSADQVKERFILSFLETFSQQIHDFRSQDNHLRNLLKRGKSDQLLRELSDSARSEKARQDFFQTFDTTFLAMYPDFVAQFNALLKEDARVIPPEGKLTTEQRIFALIRLGVDDSKQIATMLDYSLSTIYNYKVAARNNALGDREAFEQQVKKIGR